MHTKFKTVEGDSETIYASGCYFLFPFLCSNTDKNIYSTD